MNIKKNVYTLFKGDKIRCCRFTLKLGRIHFIQPCQNYIYTKMVSPTYNMTSTFFRKIKGTIYS